jgi:acetyl esterase
MQLLIYPNTDSDFDRPSMLTYDGIAITRDLLRAGWNAYRPDPRAPGSHYAAPLHVPDLSGLPPATIITGEHDMLRDEGEAYAARLAAAGVLTTLVRLPGMPHGALSFLGAAPATHRVLDVAATALRRLHDGPPVATTHADTRSESAPTPAV